MSHWRTMVQSEHFCAADLWDEENGKFQNAIVKIVKVTAGKVVGQKGRTKGLPFLSLENRRGKPLRAPFGANPTNCTSIGTALGSPDVKNWIGRWIELYVTKVDSPEGMVDAIRIHPKPPADPTKSDGKAPDPKSVTPGEVEQSLKDNGLIDQTSKDQVEQLERTIHDEGLARKKKLEAILGRELGPDDRLTDADMAKVRAAEAEEARRGG